MKRSSLPIFIFILTMFIVFLPPSNAVWLQALPNYLEMKNGDLPRNNVNEAGTLAKFKKIKNVMMLERNGFTYLLLSDIGKRMKVKVEEDPREGIITLKRDKLRIFLVRDVPVLNVNGIFFPAEAGPIWEKGQFWIAYEMVTQIEKEIDTMSYVNTPSFTSLQLTVDQMIHYLSFLQKPIKGAHVSTSDTQLPGAPRSYRNGVHEGMDWYSHTSGVPISKKTPVYALADGVVIRADHHYKEMSVRERQRLLRTAAKSQKTPEYILDKMRGRSVWIQFDKGVLARYVHLDKIATNLKAGEKVKQGDLVGYVGNSGTSNGSKGNEDEDLHLHLDILIYGELFWKNYSMDERREILEHVFNK
jgi:murein DD-endopeptidase MepM/ murein hydrolase activator NlpD